MLLLVLYIALWVFLYYLEGTHDAFITLETNEHPQAKDYVKANYYKGMWHKYDTYSYIIFHIGFAFLFAFLLGSSPFSLLSFILILVSVSLRIIFHDLFYDIKMDRSIFTIPTSQGTWDWYDCAIAWIAKHSPIHPFILRFIPLIISIAIYYIFFLGCCGVSEWIPLGEA